MVFEQTPSSMGTDYVIVDMPNQGIEVQKQRGPNVIWQSVRLSEW